ncbi:MULTISPECIES: hypothetical protein [Stenotrophomonas]|uniref:hypothetical protein n=1 Tax=Stenotrophomonas TaxID=40323 RepID=UPI0008722979|nr:MULTISPECIES: hypothetical protein [Stenotrophomonas]OEZ00188.1 hypothetical protein BIY45_12890 [Stenotrophomonas sp. BIIR7]
MRHAHCLILLLAPLAAHASDALASSSRGGCVYSAAESERPAPAAAPAAPAPATVKPSAAAPVSTGGGGDDDVIPRLRAPKWHSFLPGMFR